jgi:hypothetical protein
MFVRKQPRNEVKIQKEAVSDIGKTIQKKI